jgi:cytochrome c peroxidase
MSHRRSLFLTSLAASLLIPMLATPNWAQADGAHQASAASEALSRTTRLPRPVTNRDFYDDGRPDPMKVELGRLLFFDKLLSGNRNISCATCHHSITDTGDGLSLPVGEGGRGLGVTRDTGSDADAIHERVPRNAPPVFNLGAREFRRMFHDGRVEVDPSQPSGFRSPAGDNLPLGLDHVLAAQAMFPVTSATEMAGQGNENELSQAAALGDLPLLWERLAQRLRANDTYVDLFIQAFPDINAGADITYVHAANAIGAFEAFAWRADRSPFDQFLRGDRQAMSARARKGMHLFYGKAGCADCHSGPFLTDHEFHSVCMPQIGPGKGDGPSGHEDFGRERVTGEEADRFKFRTPSLRNVALTGPWGHTGAFNTLRDMVRHQLDTVSSMQSYDKNQVVLPYREDLAEIDFQVLNDPDLVADIVEANELAPKQLTQREFELLMDFLYALTDNRSLDLRSDTPMVVPSGLPLVE